MHRRRFLGIVGAGVAGSAAAAAGRSLGAFDGSVLGPAPDEPPDGQVDGPAGGSRRIIWSVPTDRPLVALTFDDGPDLEFTPSILDILEDFGVPATFMVMGFNAVRNSGLMRQVVAAGHEVGNHSWSHRNLRHESAATTVDEIRRGAEAVRAASGMASTFFRPPRGEFTADAIRAAAVLDHDVLIWSVTRSAPTDATPPEVARAVVSRLAPGDVVGLHDGIGRGTFNPAEEWTERLRHRRRVEVAALPQLLRDATARGLRFVTVSGLVAADRTAGGPAAGPAGEGPA